ncbi:hypothetical protein DCAR_0313867 [Daucus carota subsp. sativus]|uniref:Uncharacterized protein n=1 Tax=Daucus carota subsp. sativus TaxID=79200 RepID=A0A166C9R6_DAUCS|nr:hypothetical protein DCAR_0313867 [Daucus carota subsp. sativus]
MVRTRSGTEVHVTHPKDAEDEDEGTNGGGANDARDVEMETCGEDENQTTGDETTNNLYNVTVYYEGHFVMSLISPTQVI